MVRGVGQLPGIGGGSLGSSPPAVQPKCFSRDDGRSERGMSMVLFSGHQVPCWPRHIGSGFYVRSLHQAASEDHPITHDFSLFKFGSETHVGFFSDLLATAIAEYLGCDLRDERERWVVTTPPLGRLPRLIEQVGEQVAQRLGIDRVGLKKGVQAERRGVPKMAYSSLTSVRDRRERRSLHGFVDFDSRPLGDRNVVLLDDVMTTGTTFEQLIARFRRDLSTRKVAAFSILSIESDRYDLEEAITNRLVASGDLLPLAALLDEPGTVVTRRTLRILFGVDRTHFSHFLANCSWRGVRKVREAAKIFFVGVDSEEVAARLEILDHFAEQRDPGDSDQQ